MCRSVCSVTFFSLRLGWSVGGVRDVDGEASLERVAAEPPAADRWEQRVVRLSAAFGEPDAYHCAGRAGERRDPLLASFPFARHVRGAGELNVGDVERGELGGAQPGLDREQEQRVVAASGPGRAIRCGEQRVDLLLVEERDERSVGAFRWDREHALDVVGVFGMAQRGIPIERVDRRQAGVSGAGAVAAVGLEVIEERGDGVGVEIGDVEHRRFPPATRGGEPQQQSDRVAVGGDRVRAGVALLEQSLGEERLHGRSERTHELASCAASSRCPAIAINSGAACKYQNVCLGWVWPIYVLSSGSLDCTSTPSRYQSSSVCTANRWRRS